MKPTLLFLLIISTGFCVSAQSRAPESKKETTEARDLSLVVFTDKTHYSRNDEIVLKALLMNTTSDEIFVYGSLDWGVAGSLSLCVFDAKGKEVQRSFIDTGRTGVLTPDDPTQFVKLRPYHLLGKSYRFAASELKISTPGRFSIEVEYHPRISATEVSVKPFFGSERGSIFGSVLIDIR